MALTLEERRDLRELQLLTAKPVMYVANVDENGFQEQPAAGGAGEACGGRGAVVVAGVRGDRGGNRAAG